MKLPSASVPADLAAMRASGGRAVAPKVNPQTWEQYAERIIAAITHSAYDHVIFQISTFNTPPLAVNSTLIRPAEARDYLLVQNQSHEATLLLGIGREPDVQSGIVIAPGQSYEPSQIPQDDIRVIGTQGNGTNCEGVLIYAVKR